VAYHLMALIDGSPSASAPASFHLLHPCNRIGLRPTSFMSNYRRYRTSGGMCYFTVNLLD